MTHLAFINMPAHGHVNPTLSVVQELVKRSVRVTYALPEAFAAGARKAGAEIVPYESLYFAKPLDIPFPPNPQEMAKMPLKLVEEGEHLLNQIESHYANDKPDLICYDFMSHAGRFLAEKMEIPAVRLNPSYAANETFSLIKKFIAIDPENPALKEFAKRLSEVRARHGLRPKPPFEFMAEPESFNVVFLPRAFQYEGDSFDERFAFVGPCLREAELDGDWKPAPNNNPTLLISLGTVFNKWPEFFRMCFEAFSDKPLNVVMAAGSQAMLDSLGKVPPNFDVRVHVPQLAVLPHAAAFISHGGMNSTQESLYHGVPLVVIPQMHEQEATARRVSELGLGRFLPRPEVTVETLQMAVNEVFTNGGLRANVKAMQQTVRATGGAPMAAKEMMAFLASRQQ